MSNYTKKQPCNNCPYRKDAPRELWSIDEFIDLKEKDSDYMGAVYGCHKKDGHVCVGWLADQDKRNFPSIALRISLSSNHVTREYLDAIGSKVEMFDSIDEMCIANYPDYFIEH